MENKIEIIGIETAVDDYQWASSDPYSPLYGRLMLDRDTGEVWTDVFYSLGRNEWKVYHDPAICNLLTEYFDGREAYEIVVTVANVRKWAETVIREYRAK